MFFVCKIDLESWADWFSSIGSLGAVVVALWQHFKLERRLENETKRTQAMRVSVVSNGTAGSSTGVPVTYFQNIVTNRSDLPIYDVKIHMQLSDTNGFYEAGPRREQALEPGEVLSWLVDGSFKPHTHARDRVWVVFRDSAGLWWERDHQGALIQLPTPPSKTAPPLPSI